MSFNSTVGRRNQFNKTIKIVDEVYKNLDKEQPYINKREMKVKKYIKNIHKITSQFKSKEDITKPVSVLLDEIKHKNIGNNSTGDLSFLNNKVDKSLHEFAFKKVGIIDRICK